eukprot:TRINITY_DN7715_c0_g2_i2.p1 TRINITY_DN7715_c0_g2~~TRINITY_DN7715_c0_g2_i2.p1  ORF type:complete len:227 (-),score=57.34 TRINITY_DN7715_c0_g2_i2:551-1231(-)
MFGGVFTNQFIGTGDPCPHKREVLEKFRTISVEIKDKGNLDDALKLFIQGEMVSGVFCDLCKKNVDTIKRCVLKELPPTLVIHLKRFDFDYQTMARVKLNSVLAFPRNLDMERYTKEGVAREEGENVDEMHRRPPSYYEFELVGVVVHSGNMDSGHYYSYIQERVPLQGNSCKWFEFNDTYVTTWNPERLEWDCFGEVASSMFGGGASGRGAYLLVYQRKSVPMVD